jgi:hypothetical protein
MQNLGAFFLNVNQLLMELFGVVTSSLVRLPSASMAKLGHYGWFVLPTYANPIFLQTSRPRTARVFRREGP